MDVMDYAKRSRELVSSRPGFAFSIDAGIVEGWLREASAMGFAEGIEAAAEQVEHLWRNNRGTSWEGWVDVLRITIRSLLPEGREEL